MEGGLGSRQGRVTQVWAQPGKPTCEAEGWAAEAQTVMDRRLRHREGAVGQAERETVASKAPGGQPTWLAESQGEEPPGRTEQVGSQAEAEPTELPGGSQPCPVHGAGPSRQRGAAAELDLAPVEGGRYHGGRGPDRRPQLKRETSTASA